MYRPNKISDEIKRKYKSYRQFAQHIGIDRSSVTKYLTGVSYPRYHTSLKFVKALDTVTLEDIYGPEDSELDL